VGGARRAGGSSKSGRRASGCDRDLDATAASQEEEEKEEDGIGQSSAANLMFEREPFEIADRRSWCFARRRSPRRGAEKTERKTSIPCRCSSVVNLYKVNQGRSCFYKAFRTVMCLL
jgi:hypothetical protein